VTHLREIFLFLMVAVLVSEGRAADSGASVRIIAVSPYGRILGPVKVMGFTNEDLHGRDYASRFSGGKADGIPTGGYIARVVAEGRSITRPVQVARENTLLVLSGPELIIEVGKGQPGVIGKIVGGDGIKPLWVRLVRTFSEDLGCCTIVPLNDDYTFAFGGIESADYIILLLSDGRVLFEGRVKIENPRTRITIDVSANRVSLDPY